MQRLIGSPRYIKITSSSSTDVIVTTCGTDDSFMRFMYTKERPIMIHFINILHNIFIRNRQMRVVHGPSDQTVGPSISFTIGNWPPVIYGDAGVQLMVQLVNDARLVSMVADQQCGPSDHIVTSTTVDSLETCILKHPEKRSWSYQI